jgi:hypothetical protein
VKWSTLVRVMSSDFCAEVMTGRGHASVTASRVTIAYPVKCIMSQEKVLPSVKYSISGRLID